MIFTNEFENIYEQSKIKTPFMVLSKNHMENVFIENIKNKDGVWGLGGGLIGIGAMAFFGSGTAGIVGTSLATAFGASVAGEGLLAILAGAISITPIGALITTGLCIAAIGIGVAMIINNNSKNTADEVKPTQEESKDKYAKDFEDTKALNDALLKENQEKINAIGEANKDELNGDGVVLPGDTSDETNGTGIKNANNAPQNPSSNATTIPTISYVDQALKEALKNQEDALAEYNKTLATIMPDSSAMDKLLADQLASIKNPFEKTEETGKEEENNEETQSSIDTMKAELDFGKSDFEAIEAYSILVGDVKSYLSVKSEIKVITDIEDYKELGLNSFTGTKYVDNGQTHYVARAYDIDGKPLDAIVESTQQGYLAFGGKSGSNGYAKLTGSGNKTNYCVEGYGAITFGGVEKYVFYIQGNYDNENEPIIEISEVSGQNVSDSYKGTIKKAMETMRAVNNASYEIENDEKDTVVYDFTEDTLINKGTITEDGHEYSYNKNDKVTITNDGVDISDIDGVSTGTIVSSSTSKTLTVEEALNVGYAMKQLIEQGYEPLEKNGKEYSKESVIEEEATNATFTLSLNGTPKFTTSQVQFYTEGTKVYYTFGNYNEILKITDKDGNTYNVSSAIQNKICTIDVLLKKLETEFNVKSGTLGK